MTAKHRTPEYQRNARIVRGRVRAAHATGRPVRCWRGGGAILPGTAYDVGHIAGAIGSRLEELAPEHRSATPGCCGGNRSHGGKHGATKTNARHAPTIPTTRETSWPI